MRAIRALEFQGGCNFITVSLLCFDGCYRLAIAETAVFVPELPVLLDGRFDDGQLVGEEFLIFGTVEFVVCPLLERDVSANEKNKPADHENRGLLFFI